MLKYAASGSDPELAAFNAWCRGPAADK
jgi:hypothetical protein